MPIDYSKYPKNWKTEIRPSVLERAGHRCEQCKVPNYAIVCRGEWVGKPAYQTDDGKIFCAETGERIGSDYVGEVWVGKKQTITKIVLTVAHLDHDVENHNVSLDRLKALCQRCHLKYDKPNRKRKKQHE
jgi:5-methylcytosine-specific restriction endonuclease McrA